MISFQFLPDVLLSENLMAEQKDLVRKMLYEERDAFCKNDDDVGCAKDFEMKIDLLDSRPVQKNYVDVPQPLLRELKDYVEDLLNHGFIQKSRSSCSSPCVVLRKKMVQCVCVSTAEHSTTKQ